MKCIVESAVSCIILVIFSCLLYESRVQVLFCKPTVKLIDHMFGICYSVAEGSKLYCVVELCTLANYRPGCSY